MPAVVCPSSKRKASALSQFLSPQPAAGIKRIAGGVSSQSQISPLKPALPLLSRPRTDSFGLRSEQSPAATAAIAARIGTPPAKAQVTSFGDPGTGRPGIPLFYTQTKRPLSERPFCIRLFTFPGKSRGGRSTASGHGRSQNWPAPGSPPVLLPASHTKAIPAHFEIRCELRRWLPV